MTQFKPPETKRLLDRKSRSSLPIIDLAAVTANPYSRAVALAAAKAALSPFNLPSQFKVRDTRALDERLFDSLAECKLITNRFAMHLDSDWHRRLFSQLDMLLDRDEWDPDDEPVSQGSFTTFIRLMLKLRAARRPGLHIANGGNIVALWQKEAKDRLTIECQPNDHLRWLVTVPLDGAGESAAGDTFLDRIVDVLQPYHPEHWLHEGSQSTT